MKKQMMCLLLAICMLVSLLPLQASAADIVKSGNCGDSVTWALDSNGLLTVSGKGKMQNFSYSPWYNSGYTIQSIVIEDGVTTIGDYSFAGCDQVKKVDFPDSLVAIGDSAFAGCTSLNSITIPDNVIWIGAGSFWGSGIKSAYLSSAAIDDDAFAQCENLVSVSFGSGILVCIFGTQTRFLLQ